MANLLKNYNKLLDGTDSIFEVPKLLKEIYLNGLGEIDQSNLKYTDKNRLKNTIVALTNIGPESIKAAELTNLAKLYAQGVVLAVSNAEWLLRIIFDILMDLYIENNEKMDKVDQIQIPFKLIRDRNLSLTKEDWLEIIKDRFEEEKNPEEKLNFQNIKSIEGHFKTYFEIDLSVSPELRKQLHLYYQLRHLQIHRLGVVDKRFLKNLKTAGIQKEYDISRKVTFIAKDYEECKAAFREFFKILDTEVDKAIKRVSKPAAIKEVTNQLPAQAEKES